ncbi:hypothetical protein [Methylobacterium sp. J-067]|uniref:hypothetical protein n=1 Tax=Methylobacterium sp. J-067 TaxID=2836648 RepID=UPI001FB9BFBF|nr:hypothetical protein [Methylobacterium sp. J-067]MCJ2023955.1 hypothetical protein [Methylobacterium sp. J-067]
MNEPSAAEALTAQDAADALIALGWPIQPHGPDMDGWLVGGALMTDGDLLALAVYNGIRPPHERVH